MYLVFDTETNGLPKRYNGSAEDVENWPRISQLSYSTFNDRGELVERVNDMIRPDGWTFPDEEFFRNNADINKNIAVGIPIKEALLKFIDTRNKAEYLIAHNLHFDSMIVRAEFFRADLKPEFTTKKICTMVKSTKFCDLPPTEKMLRANMNRPKTPNLTELHTKLFGTGFEDAHDAGGDVDACAKCFFELVKRGVIVLN